MRPESSDSAERTELCEMVVRLVHSSEQPRYQELMREHHYLGHLPKIGETLWYVASWREQWVALLSFSASALKCAARDRWIGWSFRQQYARLKLVVNNSRFLILPDWHLFNWGSRVLSVKGVCRGIGKQCSGTAWCCWKPLSTRSVITGRCIGPRIGSMSGTLEDFAGLVWDTRPHPHPPRWSFSNCCGPMPVACCAARFFPHPII